MSSRAYAVRSAIASFLLLSALPLGSSPHAADKAARMKIGIIGSGHVGGALGTLWAKAGHEVLFSSRHPEELKGLAQSAGPSARTGQPREAAAFGDVVLISVPYGALPQVGRDLAPMLAGKVVLETGNPYPGRDGEMAEPALKKGTGIASAEFLPGVRLPGSEYKS